MDAEVSGTTGVDRDGGGNNDAAFGSEEPTVKMNTPLPVGFAVGNNDVTAVNTPCPSSFADAQESIDDSNSNFSAEEGGRALIYLMRTIDIVSDEVTALVNDVFDDVIDVDSEVETTNMIFLDGILSVVSSFRSAFEGLSQDIWGFSLRTCGYVGEEVFKDCPESISNSFQELLYASYYFEKFVNSKSRIESDQVLVLERVMDTLDSLYDYVSFMKDAALKVKNS